LTVVEELEVVALGGAKGGKLSPEDDGPPARRPAGE